MIDFNLNEGAPTLTSDMALVLQQIDLLFDTYPGEVIGDDEYGTTHDDNLNQLNLSNAELRDEIINDISEYVDLMSCSFDVQVYILDGTERDILLINIDLQRDEEVASKSYKII